MNREPLVAEEDRELAAQWLSAVGNPAIAGELEGVFERCAGEIAKRGPACWASGRCCNFERTGHRLYVTGLEAAYTVCRLGTIPGGPALSADSLGAALERGGCPFQAANLCGVHAIRPLGCRVYFCDRSAQAWQQEMYERLMADVRVLHERHAITYRYAEWRGLLGMFVT